MMIRKTEKIKLHDVQGEKKTIPIEVQLQSGGGSDGVVIGFADQQLQQVVVENKGGKLVVHVWERENCQGENPSHSIEIRKGCPRRRR